MAIDPKKAAEQAQQLMTALEGVFKQTQDKIRKQQ